MSAQTIFLFSILEFFLKCQFFDNNNFRSDDNFVDTNDALITILSMTIFSILLMTIISFQRG